jgi:hypothetical protein
MAEAIKDDVLIKALTQIILPSRAGKHTGKRIPKARPKARIHLSGNAVYQDLASRSPNAQSIFNYSELETSYTPADNASGCPN